ncbi:MAG: hypothetical protein GWP12_02380, partial [Nitrospirae bacterium]|nr:hypothetical protein [Nitrospirota bacterium]
HGWKFYPFERDPKHVLSGMQYVLGIKEDGQLIALLCVGKSLSHEKEFTIDFIDGRPDALDDLLRHALHLATQNRGVEMMVPKDEIGQAPILPILQHMGFAAWNGFAPDVFVYERNL